MRAFQNIFRIAAGYNAIWGLATVLFPNLIFDLLAIPRPSPIALFQCIGMMVGVYGIGYWLVAMDPVRYQGFVWIGLMGKVLGPIGFLIAASTGDLPWRFGWICLFNDLIWWIPFGVFLVKISGKQEP